MGKLEETENNLKILLKKSEAQSLLRKKLQGKGKAIIATRFNEGIVVSLGNRLYCSPHAKTFHDVLFDYLKSVLSVKWFKKEITKGEDKRNLIATWYIISQKQFANNKSKQGQVNSMPMTGAIQSYMDLSWNLFLIQNNAELQNFLIKRLKNTHRSTFQGVLYETYVSAAFIKAGFKIKFEDETDPTTTHGEFIASHENGEKYFIEAKAKQPNSNIKNFTHNLRNALSKKTNLKRIVCIELNLPKIDKSVSQKALKRMHVCQDTLTINSQPAPSAYVFFTNHPAQYNLNIVPQSYAFFFNGFKIPDFPAYVKNLGGNKYLSCMERDKPLYDLIESLKNHHEIPSTINGEHPEFSFSQISNASRLIVGNEYFINTEKGEEKAILEDGIVDVTKKEATCIMSTKDKYKRIIYCFPLTDNEVTVYKRMPETFFGVYREVGKKITKPSDLFDFFYKTCSKIPKEKLLNLLKGIKKNRDQLETLGQKELAILYCEIITNMEIQKNKSLPFLSIVS